MFIVPSLLPLYVFDENKLLLKLFRHFKGTSDQKRVTTFGGHSV